LRKEFVTNIARLRLAKTMKFTPYLIILVLFSSCTFEENVKFEKIKNVQLARVEDGMMILSAEAWFYNPNDLAGKLKSIDIGLMLNNKTIAKISHHDNIKIGKQASFSVPFRASFATEAIRESFVSSIFTLLTGNKLQLHFVGEIQVGTWGFTQTVPVDYYAEVKL